MPENTLYVGRGSKWGNPFPLTRDTPADRRNVVDAYRSLLIEPPSALRHALLQLANLGYGSRVPGEAALAELRASLPELRGKNLACWCRPDQLCHADVLLEIANPKLAKRT